MRRAILPSNALAAWAKLNSVSFDGCSIHHLGDEPVGRGFAAVADRDLQAIEGQALLTVPADLILSAEAVERHAKLDGHLLELLEAVGELSKVGVSISVDGDTSLRLRKLDSAGCHFIVSTLASHHVFPGLS